MLKLLLYLCAIIVSLTTYVLWDAKMLPGDFQQFVGAYGLHGSGTFGYMVCLGLMAVTVTGKRSSLMLLLAVAVVLVTSSANEALQYFDPQRVVDVWDFVAQFIGTFAGGLLVYTIGPVKKSVFY